MRSHFNCHHPFCNYWNGPVGVPGCICEPRMKDEVKWTWDDLNEARGIARELAGYVKALMDYGVPGPERQRAWEAIRPGVRNWLIG